MKFSTRILSSIAAAAALLAAGQASADTTWSWSYTGVGVNAAGSFTTAGNAAVAEDILSISGQRNGETILRLVPLGEASNFSYDNQFFAAAPHFSDGGMVFDVGGGDNGIINVYFFEGQTFDLKVVGGQPIEVPINFSVTAVPEAASYAYMALGLAGIGALSMRRRRAVQAA